MMDLKENEIFTDFINGKEVSSYKLTHISGQDLFVDIHVIEGLVEVVLYNNHNINFTKKSSEKSKVIHFFVKGNFTRKDKNVLNSNESLANTFDLSSSFNNFFLNIISTDSENSCLYSITYSSGESQIYLQDGLITDITLVPNVSSNFRYFN